MKVLLVAPPVVRHTERMPPYGVLALWWHARQFFDVEFLDGTHLEEAEIIARAVAGHDVVCLSAPFTATVHRVLRLGREIKALRPEISLVAGGAHATFDPDPFLDSGFDFVVRHEGELTLCALLEHLEAPAAGDPAQLQGLAFRRAGATLLTEPRPLIDDLDSLPFPDISGLDLDAYRMTSGERMFLIESSRGCCNKCSFCYTPAMWRRWRCKSAERVAREFRYYQEMGVEYLLVTDDNFAVSPRRVAEVSRLMQDLAVKIPWETPVCQDTIAKHPELPALLRAAGCETIQSAIDSGSDDLLNYYGKPTSREIIRAAFTAIQEAGMVTNTQVIVGAPVEGLRQVWSSMSFARRWADVLSISTLEPRPGTAFWDRRFREVTEQFGKGVSLLHPHPRLIEAMVIVHYLLFYLHPTTLRKAFFGTGAQQRQLKWHMLMYSATFLRKLGRLLPLPHGGDGG